MEALAGLGLGIAFAAQIGPVTLLIIRSVLRGGRAVLIGLTMAAAVAAVDLVYAVVGLAGAGRLLETERLRLLVGLAGAVVLVAVGARTLWTGVRARFGLELENEVATPKRAFLTAVAATALNPLTIALWTLSFPAAAPELELRPTPSPSWSGSQRARLRGTAASPWPWPPQAAASDLASWRPSTSSSAQASSFSADCSDFEPCARAAPDGCKIPAREYS